MHTLALREHWGARARASPKSTPMSAACCCDAKCIRKCSYMLQCVSNKMHSWLDKSILLTWLYTFDNKYISLYNHNMTVTQDNMDNFLADLYSLPLYMYARASGGV